MLVGVITNAIPFLIIYFIWVAFFALSSFILSANKTSAASFKPLFQAMRYFFTTFENSLGNISSPNIDFIVESKTKSVDYIVIYMVYLLWWVAQIMLLIILLNFVIALISQYYEDVMNRKVMHSYVMKNSLNHEHYVF